MYDSSSDEFLKEVFQILKVFWSTLVKRNIVRNGVNDTVKVRESTA